MLEVAFTNNAASSSRTPKAAQVGTLGMLSRQRLQTIASVPNDVSLAYTTCVRSGFRFSRSSPADHPRSPHDPNIVKAYAASTNTQLFF